MRKKTVKKLITLIFTVILCTFLVIPAIAATENETSITDDEAYTLIHKRLWLWFTCTYNNTEILDFTRTPMKDTDGTEWYPLVGDFSARTGFEAYLKEIFTENIAMAYIDVTSIRTFGSELYDIGGKVSVEKPDYNLFTLTRINDYGDRVLFNVTLTGMPDGQPLTVKVGICRTEKGWRIGYDGFTELSEADISFGQEKPEQSDEENPTTADCSPIFPALFALSFADIFYSLISYKSKTRG